jgi:hypothetical protein
MVSSHHHLEESETEQQQQTEYQKLQRERHIALNRSQARSPHDDKMDFVHIGNYNWNLVLHMLFGIR